MKEYSKNKKVILATVMFAVAVFAAAVIFISGKGINIGTDRQFVWNSRIIDTEKTTAFYRQHSPVKQGIVLKTDKPWEGNISDNFNIVDTGDSYMMYYSTYNTKNDVKICVAQSKEGIAWEKPELNIVQFDGNTANNILFDESSGITGGFFAFKDTNPESAAEEKFKAIAVKSDNNLAAYISADGINWEGKNTLSGKISADSQKNATLCSAFWNNERQKYYCYYIAEGDQRNTMLTTSKDFSDWSKPVKVKYHSSNSKSVYSTANIMPYYRSSDMLVGLPLRATVQNTEDISRNFDGKEKSAVLTDTVFIFSEDGKKFDASADAWLSPGPQSDTNWIFGDCFVAGGMVETPSIHSDKGQDNELSVYVAENMLADSDTQLARYTFRTDGFASYNAPYSTKKLVTKPLKFDGSRMTVNFRTSTDGYVYVRFLDKSGKPFDDIQYTTEDGTQYTVPEYTSYKMIGDRVDREVVFNGDISQLAGKTVVIEFYLSDADIYSFAFDNNEYRADSVWQPEEIEIREYSDFSYEVPENPVDIGTERQLFVDDYIVDKTKTDAVLLSHSPERKEELFRTDLPWEGDNCDFYVIVDDVDDQGINYHRMYYLGWDSSDFTDIRVCYAYSYDGIEWIKPDLGLHTFTDKNTGKTYTQTNIMLYTEEAIFDNFFVMKDTRPGVPSSQQYKAICQGRYDQLGYPSYGLWAWVSADGLHWKKTHRVLPQLDEWFGSFDSVNSLVWDDEKQQFFTYFRVREEQLHDGIEYVDYRKIYGATGNEFEPFDTRTLFELNYGENYPLFEMYTNNISKYYRAPQMFIGFPTRFSRNFIWAKNYEYLSDPRTRLKNYESQPTRTLSMTDAMFMTSRDGYTWNRVNEAFITPGPEYQANWIYGNCYPAYGLVETAADNPGGDNQLSTYIFEGKFYNEPSVMYRYVMRMDGFRSYKGNSGMQKVTTKPVTFTGSEMLLNFRTSAAGSVVINILDENGDIIDGYTSGRLIGDNTDRKVSFENDLSRLNGQAVTIEFVLTDAEIYSFKFQ